MTAVDEPRHAPTVGLDLPEPEVRPRRERPSIKLPEFLQRTTWRFWIVAPLMAALVLAVPVLAWKGFEILRTEKTGHPQGPTASSPDEPGFSALVTPTPTTLILDKGPDGTLQGATLLTRPSEEGGGNVVYIPIGTVLPVPFVADEVPLNQIYADGGASAVEQRIETMLGAAITEVVEVPRDQWANLVEPVAPLTVQNPSAASTTNDAGQPVAFPEGEVHLTPQQVGLFLQADTTEEADTVRISRHDAFWTAWLAALDEAGDGAVPGEGETGVAGAVRGLIGGPRNQETLPVTPVAVPGIPAIDSDIFRPNTLEIVAQVPTLIPYPSGVGRLRTRLVMGVEDQWEQMPAIAHQLVQAGAEVSVVATADPFGEAQTQVVFFRGNQREKAQRLLDALGVGTLVKKNTEGDNFDVVVVIGQDYIDRVNGSSATTVAGSVPSSVPTGGVAGNGIPGGVTPGLPGGETTG